MPSDLKRRRLEECLSDLHIDRLTAGELGTHEVSHADRHRQHCTRCAARVLQIQAEQETYLASPPAVALRDELGARARAKEQGPRLRGPARAWLIAAAATLGIVVMAARPEGDGSRAKGGEQLGFHVQHQGRARRGHDGETVRPHDLLRFSYSSAQPVHLVVLSLDAARVASVYFSGGPLEAGQNVALSSSVELDEILGVEQIYGLFCAHPQQAEALARDLQARADRWSPPASCKLHSLRIKKEPRD